MDRSHPLVWWRRQGHVQQLVPYLVGLLLLVLLHQQRLAETLNLALHDQAIRLRPAPSAAATPIRLITISETDLRQLGWPLQDDQLAAAIDRLTAAGVGAIGLDLYRDIGVGQGQQRLRRLGQRLPALVSVYSEIDGIGPLPGSPPHRQAYNDLLLDADGVVRRDLLHVRHQGAAAVALPLRLLEVWRGQRISPLRARLERQPDALPRLQAGSGGYSHLDEGGVQRLLAFHRPGSFPSWSLAALLAGQVPPQQLRGAIVLIGSTAPSLRDGFTVPYGAMPGVEVHAHRLAALLVRDGGGQLGLEAAPGWANALLVSLALAVGLGLAEGIASLRRSLVVVAAVAGLGLLLGLGLLVVAGLWFNLALPLAALLAMATAGWTRRGAEQQRQQRHLRQLLGQTLSAAVARELWRQRDGLMAGGQFRGRELAVSLLIADFQGFTAVAEGLPPEPLLAWLNQGLALLVRCIQDQGGLVNKFTGDGVLAVFGAPLGRGPEQEAAAAVAAAAAIRQGLVTLNQSLATAGDPPLRVRIGIHSGSILAGSVGGADRWEYGLIGDAVNCTARLEALEKHRCQEPCRILVSAATRELLGPAAQGSWRPWGGRVMAGRSGDLEVWELVEGPSAGEGRAGCSQTTRS
ncbi:MAG: adenylate/guanylate cyclase domain-containing protein [Cyanobacteriota bacterium]|nr:adenylate/guanylate cyclase domain-containing protein [Cyanobacteriota bacterium]